MSVLKIKNEKGEWVGITSIKGEKGDPGDIASHAACHASDGTDPITPEQIGAAPENHTHTASEVGAATAGHTHTASEVGAATAGHTHTAREIGAAASKHTHKASEVEAAPNYSYGTEDLEAGVSTLETGKLYFVYE